MTEPDMPPRLSPNTDGGWLLHLPDITHLDTQAWSVDIGLTDEALAALRTLLAGQSRDVEHCTHYRPVHDQHHTSPVTGCPWCTQAATSTEE